MTALAIDAGFGVMKYSRRSQEGKVQYAAFPAVAIPTGTRTQKEFQNMRDTTFVQYEGHTYMVGPDVRHELAGNEFGRDLTDNYYNSHIYHALMRGALALMHEDTLDVLVLGLPMDRFDYPSMIQGLEKHYRGKIDLGFGKSVEIKDVIIHPQPFGGYIGLGNHLDAINATIHQYPQAQLPTIDTPASLRNLNVLVVDSGAYTLDWIFMAPSGAVRAASGAANNAGRHRVVRRLYDAICNEIGRKPPISFLFDIDEAERLKKPMRLDGRMIDFSQPKYQTLIEEAVEDSVQQMFEHLGGNIDRIDLIAVVGGEPQHIANAISKRKQQIPVFVPPEKSALPSIFTNLAGFQEYAEAFEKDIGGKR